MSSRPMLIRGYIFKVEAIWGHVFKVRFCWWSRFIRGTVFKVSVDWLSCLPVAAFKAILMLGGEDAGTSSAGWGHYIPDSGPGVHPLLPVACLMQRKPCFQGQGSLKVLPLRSRYFGSHVFKVRVIRRSCLQGQCCLEDISSRSMLFWVMSSRAGLIGGGQGSLEVMVSRSLLISCHVFL